jgi:hypothetical protein
MFIRVSSEKELRRYGVVPPSELAKPVVERIASALIQARNEASGVERVCAGLPGVKEINLGWAKRYPTYADPLSGQIKRTVLLEGVTLTAEFACLVQSGEPCLFYELCAVAAPRRPLGEEARRYVADFYAQALSRALPNALPERPSPMLGFYTVRVVERVTKPLRDIEARRHD